MGPSPYKKKKVGKNIEETLPVPPIHEQTPKEDDLLSVLADVAKSVEVEDDTLLADFIKARKKNEEPGAEPQSPQNVESPPALVQEEEEPEEQEEEEEPEEVQEEEEPEEVQEEEEPEEKEEEEELQEQEKEEELEEEEVFTEVMRDTEVPEENIAPVRTEKE